MLTFCWHNIALSQLTLNADNNTTVPASATDGAASHCQHQGKAEVSLEAVSLSVVTNQYDDDLGTDRSQSMSWVWRVTDGVPAVLPVWDQWPPGPELTMMYRWSAAQVSAQGDSWHGHENIIHVDIRVRDTQQHGGHQWQIFCYYCQWFVAKTAENALCYFHLVRQALIIITESHRAMIWNYVRQVTVARERERGWFVEASTNHVSTQCNRYLFHRTNNINHISRCNSIQSLWS